LYGHSLPCYLAKSPKILNSLITSVLGITGIPSFLANSIVLSVFPFFQYIKINVFKLRLIQLDMLKIKEAYNKVMNDSLYRNSMYLMIGTAIMSVLGFVAWAIISKIYSAEEVGLATTIISVMGIITSFSVLGLNAGLIRFLPKSGRKNDKINTTFTLAALVSIIVTSVFLLGLKGFSPSLLFIKQNLIYSIIFIIFMVFATLGSLIESVFIAYRASGFVLLKNTIFSFGKMAFPFLFVSFGAYGIFGSWMLSLILGYVVVFLILIYKFAYKPKLVFYDSIIEKIGKYSFGNYISGFIGGLPILMLPVLITNLHHPELTAYFYMAMMVANVLFIIPNATTSSLFAEGSNNEKALGEQIKKAIKIISWLIIPAIIITIFIGKYVLLFFGNDYSIEGYGFLQVLAFSGIFISINSVFGAILRVKKKIGTMIIMNIINTGVILLASYFLVKEGFGLWGVGIAWISGQALVSLIYFAFLRK